MDQIHIFSMIFHKSHWYQIS